MTDGDFMTKAGLYAFALSFGGECQKRGVPYKNNPFSSRNIGKHPLVYGLASHLGSSIPHLASQWSRGWKRSYETDPARANDPRIPIHKKPKRHAGHTGGKNRV